MIRAATEQDIPSILNIVRASVAIMQQNGNTQWSADYPDETRFRLDVASGTLFVYETSGAVSGVICACTEPSPEYEAMPWKPFQKAMIIHRMAVNPPARGAGIATQLIEFCEELARSQNCDAIHTDTNSRNLPVNTLMQKMGYTPVGQITLRSNPHLFNCYEKIVKTTPIGRGLHLP